MLGKYYRVQAKNELGQTIAIAGLEVKALHFKRNADGTMEYDSAADTLLANSGGTVTNGSYFDGTPITNSDEWEGADVFVTVVAPASSSGDVIFYLQRSDDGIRWPDDGTGRIICIINFTTSGTKERSLQI